MRSQLRKLKSRLLHEVENPSTILIFSGILLASTWSGVLFYQVFKAHNEVMQDTLEFLKNNHPKAHSDVIQLLLIKDGLI